MITKKLVLAAGLLVGNALAVTSVWDAVDGNGDVPPVGGWYTYPTKATSTTSATLDKEKDEKALSVKVSTTDDESSAGMGFAFAKSNGTKDLSAYEGVCLSYSALKPFKFDVKQSSVKDYDFYGMVIPASTSKDTLFVPFSKLSQEGWGDEVSFAPKLVQAFQFGYKKSIAADAKSATNKISIFSVSLGSSCSNHAPALTELFAGYDKGTIGLKEGDIHSIKMSEVFEDADGDDLKIKVKIESDKPSVLLTETDSVFSLSSTIHFKTVANPKANANVTITATDPSKKSAVLTFTIETEDVNNLPVAKNFEFEVLEDSSYSNGLGNRVSSWGEDYDGDEIKFVLVDGPAHGTLTFSKSGETFTYVPEEDFNGKDSFTYKFVEAEDETRESELGTCTITVTPVNDKPVVEVVAKTFVDDAGEEHAFGDTLVVDEDFKDFSVMVPVENISISDIDGEEDIVISAKASGVVKAEYVAVKDFYGIGISAIKDANGVAKVSLALGDHASVVSSPVICYVKVNPVDDPPVPEDDSYKVVQDSLNEIAAKNGVLANDLNPDSIEVSAVLVEAAGHGVVKLEKDGSFTYESESGYEGEDFFGYVIVYGKADTTSMAIVTLEVGYKNKAPTINEGVLDTVGNRLAKIVEDFTSPRKYTKAEVLSWFSDDADKASDLKFSARSDDSLTNPSFTTAGVLQIASVKNACGEAEVIVTAKDTQGATTDLKIPAVIQCVNDKPVVVLAVDTVYLPEKGWESKTVDMNEMFSDPDGDTLKFTVTDNMNFKRQMSYEVDGSNLIVSLLEDGVLNKGETYNLSVKAADSAGLYVTAKVLFVIGDEPKKDTTDKDTTDAIAPVLASKMNWQTAIAANRGSVTMMDMQGRVLWIRRLPVSEAEVRAASASIQGRKILKVNSQVWTIK